MLRRRLVRKSEPLYPRFRGAYNVVGGRVKSCVRLISRDPVGFRAHLCVFRLVSSDLRLSSIVMVVALVCWSFVALA
jgi:hypothetical protein